jgi:hypothetical protein
MKTRRLDAPAVDLIFTKTLQDHARTYWLGPILGTGAAKPRNAVGEKLLVLWPKRKPLPANWLSTQVKRCSTRYFRADLRPSDLAAFHRGENPLCGSLRVNDNHS